MTDPVAVRRFDSGDAAIVATLRRLALDDRTDRVVDRLGRIGAREIQRLGQRDAGVVQVRELAEEGDLRVGGVHPRTL